MLRCPCFFSLVTFLLFLISVPSAVGQVDTIALRRPVAHAFTVSGGGGWIILNTPFLKGENSRGQALRGAGMLSAAFAWEGGAKLWQRALRLPQWGVAVGTTWLGDRGDLGQPISLYGFIAAPIVRRGPHTLGYRIELGAALGWKPYNERSNALNTMVGTWATLHIGLGLEYAYQFNAQWRLALGAGLTHFSNGCLRKPNVGLNIISPSLRLTYTPVAESRGEGTSDTEAVVGGPPPPPRGGALELTVGYAAKYYDHNTALHPDIRSKYYDGGSRYNVVTFRALYYHRYGWRGRWGAGLSVVYDEMQGADERANPGGKVKVVLGEVGKRFNVGVMASHEFCFGRVGAVTDLGFDFWRLGGIDVYYRKLRFFQRLGAKCHLPKGFLAYVGIHAYHFTRADFLEWSLGYEIPLARKNKSRSLTPYD